MRKIGRRTGYLLLCLAWLGLPTTEAAGQGGSGDELVRLIRSGGMATLEIGPVAPNAYLPLLILPNRIEDASHAGAALSNGAHLAKVFRADANGMFELTYPMEAINSSLRVAAYSWVQGVTTYLGTFVPNPMHESFQPPPRKPLGPVSIEVHPDQVVVLNGPGPEDDEVLAGGNYPLITALRAATPGSDPVIGIYGAIRGDGMQIGAGDSDFKGYVAHWGPVPMRFSVVGMTPDAKIGELGFRNRMNNGTVHGGVEDARFENLTIEARYNMAVGGGKGERFGILRFYDVHFAASQEGLASGAFEGFGYKWGVRIRALGRYDFRNCSFDPVLEHAIYVDSPQGDSYFVGIEHNGSTRTAIQIVNRAFDTNNPADWDEFESGAQTPQPSGHGRLLIEDVTIRDLRGDGGSAITVAGHPGDVFIRNINAVDLENTFQGAVVVYTDAGPNHGTYLHTGGDGELYSTYSLSVEGLNINLPHADRTHVGLSGIEFVRIHDFSIVGSRTAIALDSWYNQARFNNSLVVIDGDVTRASAWINNGSVDFLLPRPLSQYPGFDSASKIANSWYLDVGGSHRSNLLSNAEIDAIWGVPGPSTDFIAVSQFPLVPFSAPGSIFSLDFFEENIVPFVGPAPPTGQNPFCCFDDLDPTLVAGVPQSCAPPVADGTSCDDGDPSTVNDVCSLGICQGAAPECTAHAQCDDGNSCNGTESCQAFQCMAGVPLTCTSTQCTSSSCDPASGCQSTPLVDGTPCNDGNPLNFLDACLVGVCLGSECTEDAHCDDGDMCTTETCDSVLGCVGTPVLDATACYDQDPVTIGDFCETGACVELCNLDTDCPLGAGRDYLLSWPAPSGPNLAGYTLYLAFEPAISSEGLDLGFLVSDPNDMVSFLLAGLNARANYYAEVTAYNGVGDEIVTMDEILIPALPCDTAGCDDGNPCTVDGCSGFSCTNEVVPDGIACDDGDTSTIDDVCLVGACEGVVPECTTNFDCDDGDACNGDESCENFECVAGSTPTCAPSSQCIDSFCDYALGCRQVPRPDGTGCNDGNSATVNDACVQGICQGIFPECWEDFECNDGDVCNGTEICQDFACAAGSAPTCPAPTQCTSAFCDPVNGCQVEPVADDTPCNDGNHFTENDVCSAGVCSGDVVECSQVQCEEGDFWCLLQKVLLQLVGQIDASQPRPCN